MLKSLLELFAQPSQTAELSAADARLALATLLVRIARADGQYHRDERAMIVTVIRDRFALDASRADALCTEAETLEASAPDTVRFTKLVKQAVPYEDRAGVVEALWRVALADGSRDFEEDGQIRLMVNLLGVNDRDSGLARQKVIAENGQ